jgi:hypothetical protein
MHPRRHKRDRKLARLSGGTALIGFVVGASQAEEGASGSVNNSTQATVDRVTTQLGLAAPPR